MSRLRRQVLAHVEKQTGIPCLGEPMTINRGSWRGQWDVFRWCIETDRGTYYCCTSMTECLKYKLVAHRGITPGDELELIADKLLEEAS